MLVLKKLDDSRQLLLTWREKEELKQELKTLYSRGGRNISIQHNKNLSNFFIVYDENNNKMGKIVGNSAILISEIIGKSEDFVFMTAPISIESILKDYIDEL